MVRLRGGGKLAKTDLRKSNYTFHWDEPVGAARVAFDGGPEIQHFGFRVKLRTADGRIADVFSVGASGLSRTRGRGRDALGAHDSLRVTYEDRSECHVAWTLKFYDEFITAGLRVENGGAGDVRVLCLEPFVVTGEKGGLRFQGDADRWTFYNLGYQSWSPAGAMRTTETAPFSVLRLIRRMQVNAATPVSLLPGNFAADGMGAVKDLDSGAGLVAGFATFKRHFGDVRLRVDAKELEFQRFSARVDTAGMVLSRDETFETEPVYVAGGPDALAVVERYVGTIAQTMKARRPESVPSGWCTWYRYYQSIDEKKFLKNLDWLAANRDALKVDVVQLDGGYETAWGDWIKPNRQFPGGLKALAEAVRERGFTPGLWIAPFSAEMGSWIHREHPEWLIRNHVGAPQICGFVMYRARPFYGLDCTREDVRRWLAETCARLTREYGFEYLKLDFLYSAAVDGVYQDPNVTRGGAYRMGLETVREAVGEDVFLVGCGAPIGPSIGLVDAMRVGNDVAPFWRMPLTRHFLGTSIDAGTKLCLVNAVTRSILHNRLWANDPDCLLVRRDHSRLSEAEVRTLATVTALSGGLVFDGDDLTALGEDELQMLRKTLPASGCGARALDALDGPEPRLFHVPLGRAHALAVVDWEDRSESATVGLQQLGVPKDTACHVVDFWREQYLGRHTGDFVLDPVPPHDTTLLFIVPDTEADDPAAAPLFLAATLHVLGGQTMLRKASWNASMRRFRMEFQSAMQREGRVFVRLPKGSKFDALRATKGGSAGDIIMKGQILSYALSFNGKATIDIHLKQTKSIRKRPHR